ncbi:MAG: exodeoxyribonuclease VII large subunit [Acetobacteraceae bacterium]|nr:exodeoxyribonuclease VII large subunit [Acetobacteraceae bacterium]
MSEAVAAPSNVPEYTVSEISGAVKRTLEGAFGRVRVRGEITEFKRYPSGHLYFSLKDEGAKIGGVVWKSGVARLGLVPENGVEVIATGRISSYAERSSYQLIVERMEYAGAGALLARIEMLRKRLAEEGLFGQDRKRHIPLLPDVVGVVTSASGAVLHDIRTTIARRFPRPVLLWPVPVQGEGAAARIAAAIIGFDAIIRGGPIPRPDVLIVARGGGSLEDLMAFNDEAVIRAAAACRIPLISAVGHETDHTLVDLVSDRRAATPTAAAEMAVPSKAELASVLMRDGARLAGGLMRMVGERRVLLGRAERGLPDLPSLLGGARQRLDDRVDRLRLALPNLLRHRRSALDRAERAIPDAPALLQAARISLADKAHRLRLALPNLVRERRAALNRAERAIPDAPALLRAARQALAQHGTRLGLALPNLVATRRHAMVRVHLDAALRHAVAGHRRSASPTLARLSPAMLASSLREAHTRLEAARARLESVSYEKVLERGFALVSDGTGHKITRATGVRPGARLQIRFADGTIGASADAKGNPAQGALPF